MAYTSPSIPASGTTFAQLQAGGPSAILEKLIAALTAGTSPPGAPTLSATGGGTTGGNLPAGTIYIKVTETNGIGETTPYGTEVNAAISAGNVPQVTFAALQSGNVARNVYVGTASGAEVLYATGITAGTYNLGAAIPTNSYAVATPTANTTGLTPPAGGNLNNKMAALRAVEKGRLQGVWDNLAQLVGNFNRGEPVAFRDAVQKVRDAHTVFAVVAEICAEMGTLIDANPGTLGGASTPIGGMKVKRHWP